MLKRIIQTPFFVLAEMVNPKNILRGAQIFTRWIFGIKPKVRPIYTSNVESSREDAAFIFGKYKVETSNPPVVKG